MAVIGFTDLVLDTNLDETQFDHVKSIQQGGEALLVIINDILDFSKIEAGRMEFSPVDFNPAQTIADVVRLMVPKVKNKPVGIIHRN